jgi:transcriptional regulator with XRE-family HTH domain
MGIDSLGHRGYTMPMSAKSAMIYLRALRERHGWSRPKLERLTNAALDRKQLYRWEQEGKKFPDAAELGIWARAVRASFAHLEVLLQEGDVSEAAAQAMADDRWDELQDPNNTAAQEAIDLIAQLRAHPVLLGRWIEYGERLLDAIDDSQ